MFQFHFLEQQNDQFSPRNLVLSCDPGTHTSTGCGSLNDLKSLNLGHGANHKRTTVAADHSLVGSQRSGDITRKSPGLPHVKVGISPLRLQFTGAHEGAGRRLEPVRGRPPFAQAFIRNDSAQRDMGIRKPAVSMQRLLDRLSRAEMLSLGQRDQSIAHKTASEITIQTVGPVKLSLSDA